MDPLTQAFYMDRLAMVSLHLKTLREERDRFNTKDTWEIRHRYNVVCDRLDVLESKLKKKCDSIKKGLISQMKGREKPLSEREKQLCRNGHKVMAVREYWNRNGTSLIDAKHRIDRYMKRAKL